MTDTANPGAPRTDELARNAAYNSLRDEHQLGAETAYEIVDQHTVTWETDVNSAGVPVRRYVLRGAWEVDPAPPVHLPRKGDVVCFTEHEDGEFPTIHHGIIAPGQEWIVRSVPWSSSTDSLLLLALADWPDGDYINAYARQVVIVRRPIDDAREADARPHCKVADGPCPGNERGVICAKSCEEDQAVPTRIVGAAE